MEKWILYHNPKCSKSSEALALLQSQSTAFEVVEYLKNPPSEKDLRAIVAKLQGPLSALVRTKEEEFQSAPFDVQSEEVVIQKILQQPKLLERPLLLTPSAAVIGRPLENIEAEIKRAGK